MVLISYLSGFDEIWWSKPCSVRSYDKTCVLHFLKVWSWTIYLYRVVCAYYISFYYVVILQLSLHFNSNINILLLFNKTDYSINNNDIFIFILSDLISFLNSFFSWSLLSNSCSMIILPISFFNLLLLVCIDSRIVAKVGNRCSCLHNFMYSISSLVVSNCFKTFKWSQNVINIFLMFPYK